MAPTRGSDTPIVANLEAGRSKRARSRWFSGRRRFDLELRPPNRVRQATISRQRLTDDLIHVVVAVSGQSSDKADVRSGHRQRLVTLIQRLILVARHGIVEIALGGWIFVGKAGARVNLAGEMLVLGDAGIGSGLAGMVDRGHRLDLDLRL